VAILFEELPVHADVLAGIQDMGYSTCTPIQEQAIPVVLDGKDIIGCAQTGTGKTAAFVIPMLHRILEGTRTGVGALVIVPTRELAKQIDEMIDGLSYHSPVRSVAIYGGGKGEDWSVQQNAIKNGADIVIATPGRLIAHMQLGYVDFSTLKFLVLDEADKMLDMGFAEDILSIIKKLPDNRQSLLFSATMPPNIRKLAKQILKDPTEISLAVSLPAEKIKQTVYFAHDHQKIALLEALFKEKQVGMMVLFTSRKRFVNDIVRALAKLGFKVDGIHSDKDQDERERILNDFRNKNLQILVATDILSRGIDVDGITHVLNFDCPQDPEDYIHRIGRTARAAADGEAFTFVNADDMRKLERIEKMILRPIPKVDLPEGLGPGPDPNVMPPKENRFGGNNRGGGFKAKPGGNHFKPKDGAVASADGSKKPFKKKFHKKKSNPAAGGGNSGVQA